MLVKLDHFPRDRGEHKIYLKSPRIMSVYPKRADESLRILVEFAEMLSSIPSKFIRKWSEKTN